MPLPVPVVYCLGEPLVSVYEVIQVHKAKQVGGYPAYDDVLKSDVIAGEDGSCCNPDDEEEQAQEGRHGCFLTEMVRLRSHVL